MYHTEYCYIENLDFKYCDCSIRVNHNYDDTKLSTLNINDPILLLH